MEHCACHVNENSGRSEALEKVLTLAGILIFILNFVLVKREIYGDKIQVIFYAISYIFISYKTILNGIKNVFKQKALDENFLMSLATIGALILGEYLEAVMVILLYKIGEYLQDLAVDKATEKIEDAISDIRQEYANLKVENKVEKVSSKDLKVGDIIVVKNGEKIPVDGRVVRGSSSLDTSPITGESVPVHSGVGDTVISGSINIGEVIEIVVQKKYNDSTVSKIVEFIENSNLNKSRTEKYITRFSKIYTPVVVILAILIAVFVPIIFKVSYSVAISRALIFLVISCPCALVISIPLSFFIGIGQASKKGIVIKGSNYLDLISNLDVIAFDKTGTLTKGNFSVSKVVTLSEMTENEILEVVAYGESLSNHFIAKSIVEKYGRKIDHDKLENYSEISGFGISVTIDGKTALIGNKELLEKNSVKILEKENLTGTIVHLAVDGKHKGYIALSDEIKENSYFTIGELKKMKINTIMLTGDDKKVAENVSNRLGMTKVYGKMLPIGKCEIINDLISKGNRVGFVGDGINDSPVISAATLGIAMGSGAAISVQVADIVIMNDDPKSIIDIIKTSKYVKSVVAQNIVFALTIKLLFLVLSLFGISNMWMAIFADVGVALITIVNSLRIAKK